MVFRDACRGLCTLLLEHSLLDFPQAAYLAPHLDLGMTISLQHGLGHVADEMVVAVTMRHSGEFRGDPLHECVLLVRQPEYHGLANRFGPLLSLGDQPPYLVLRRREQGLREPDALLGQLPHDVESLVSFLGLQAIDREEDLPDRSVLSPQGLEVLLARGKHDLIPLDVPGDGVFRELDVVLVLKLGSNLRYRPVT